MSHENPLQQAEGPHSQSESVIQRRKELQKAILTRFLRHFEYDPRIQREELEQALAHATDAELEQALADLEQAKDLRDVTREEVESKGHGQTTGPSFQKKSSPESPAQHAFFARLFQDAAAKHFGNKE